MATGTYRIDGVYGQIPDVRMGGSRTIDNRLHLDAPDQGATAYEMTVIPTQQQGGYTPGPAPSVQLSVDGGPVHRFSFTWRPALQSGNLGTWNSNRVEFGGLSRGDHVLHETLSMPAGSPDGVYELGAEAYMEGPCAMVTGTKMGGVSYWFTSGNPAQASAPAPGGSATRKPSPRATATGTPEPSATSVSPSPSPSDVPSPSASPMPSPSPTPSAVDSPSAAGSPTAVPLAATPAAHNSSVPWVLGALVAVAALAAGGVLALRRRRVAGDAGEAAVAETAALPVVGPVPAAEAPAEVVPAEAPVEAEAEAAPTAGRAEPEPTAEPEAGGAPGAEPAAAPAPVAETGAAPEPEPAQPGKPEPGTD